MMHGPGAVRLGEHGQAAYVCSCGETRAGDLPETGKLMREHEDAARWREFQEAALGHRKVWILGREVQL